MGTFLNPGSILSLFIASTLGFLVAPHLSLVSRTAGLAMKLAAAALAAGVALTFLTPMLMSQLYRWNLPVEPMQLIGPLTSGAFWACLAWCVLAVVQTARPKGVL
jgi:hypothetical protein